MCDFECVWYHSVGIVVGKLKSHQLKLVVTDVVQVTVVNVDHNRLTFPKSLVLWLKLTLTSLSSSCFLPKNEVHLLVADLLS